MKKSNLLLIGLILSSLLITAIIPTFLSQISQNQTLEQVPDTSPTLIAKSQYLGPAPPTLIIQVMIIPQLNMSTLTQYIQNLYNPSSPSYHKFLNASQIYQDFTISKITPDIASYASLFGIKVNDTIPLFPILTGTIGSLN